MAERLLPRYPVYVLSKDRHQDTRALTARFLANEGVPFTLAVESHQVEEYRALARRLEVPEEWVADVGFSNLGQGCSSVRNWISDHAREAGHAREWQLDDNSYGLRRWYRGKRIPCMSGVALALMEEFADRYENVGLAGPNYMSFVVPTTVRSTPFWLNAEVYSCTLHNTAMPYRWRGPYNEDTDMCLQVLAGGWCTIRFNAFMLKKVAAFAGGTKRTVEGGMSELYKGDGRLEMARSLERRWPHVVRVDRRFQRPQHVIDWKRFKAPLRLRPDVDLDAMPKVDEHGMTLSAVRPPKSPRMRQLIEDFPG